MKSLAIYGHTIVLILVTPHLCRGQFDFRAQRERLVRDELAGAGITSPRVLAAIRATDRHEFVPRDQRKLAYFDMSLPIGEQQTISSPFIVAFMTQSLDPQPRDKVLEIGTGSGYQAAILSPLVEEVFSIEILPSLGQRARQTLRRLKLDNVHVRIGDGFQGWPEHAPFDKIIVTCSPENVPKPLIDQLKEEGRMVVPVGERYQQTLYLLRKVNGELVREALRPTLFVPMTGRAENLREVQPDAASPAVVNGSFEEEPLESGQLPGWYYQRQAQRAADKLAPAGKFHLALNNETPGRASRVLQGFAVDGRKVQRVKITGWVKSDQIKAGERTEDLPMIVVTFYDSRRDTLGQRWLGPWRNVPDWQRVEKSLRVPPGAREAILRVGMFGATGQFFADDIHLTAAGAR